MAFTASTDLERKANNSWTREQRVIQKVVRMQQTGIIMTGAEIDELLAVLEAVDDYSKGTTTAMDAIATAYTAWEAEPNIR